MSVDVLCIGHASLDLSVFLDGYPQENTKSETHEMLEACGGPAANAAYLLSAWKTRCAFAGLVGDDVFGRRIRDEFREVGTDVSLLELRPEGTTPLSMILVNRHNGSRTIVNRKDPRAALQLSVADLQAVGCPRLLLFDGHELDASLAALEAFPDAITILDAGSLRPGTEALAGRVDYLAASERFARQVTKSASLETPSDRQHCLDELAARFETKVIITLGEKGLIAQEDGGGRELAAFLVKAVDTTAAGDIFHGAFAYAMLQGMGLWPSLRLASCTAALSVQSPGGRASIPTLDRVREALANES